MATIISFMLFVATLSVGILLKSVFHSKKVNIIEMMGRVPVNVTQPESKKGPLEQLEDYLIKSGTGITVNTYLIILAAAIILTATITYMLTDSKFLAVIGGAGGAYIPNFILNEIKKRYRDQFCNMFILFLQHITGSIKSGMTLLGAIEDVKKTKILPQRIREEAALLLLDYEYKPDIYEAVMGMYRRTKSEDVHSLALSIKQSEKYSRGQVQMLEAFTKNIIERQASQAKIRARLSENKIYAIVIGIIPVVMGFYFTMSGYLDSLRDWGGGIGKYIIALTYVWVLIVVMKMWNESNIEL